MSYDDSAGVFARRDDADWAMFCRGLGPAAGDLNEAVELEPGNSENERAPARAAVRHFVTRVVGIPYPNPDGTSRRDAVRELRRWDRLRLAHRPDNPVDPNAVAVLRSSDGRQCGYL